MRIILTALVAAQLLLGQAAKQALYDDFLASKSEPLKAYAIAQQFLRQYPEDDEQGQYVRRWITAYQKVMANASSGAAAEIPGYPSTLLTGFGATAFSDGNRGHLFLEPERFVFKGDKGELTIAKADILKVEAFSEGKFVANDYQGFVIERRVAGKSKPERIVLFASTEAWVTSHDKGGRMADPKPLVEKIDMWLGTASAPVATLAQPVPSVGPHPLSAPSIGSAPPARSFNPEAREFAAVLTETLILPLVKIVASVTETSYCTLLERVETFETPGIHKKGDFLHLTTLDLRGIPVNSIEITPGYGDGPMVGFALQSASGTSQEWKGRDWGSGKIVYYGVQSWTVRNGTGERVAAALRGAVASCQR